MRCKKGRLKTVLKVVEVYGLKICKPSVCKGFRTHLRFLVACPLVDTRFVADF